MKKLIIIGGGGHAKSCLDVVLLSQKYQTIGIIDLEEKKGTKLLGIEIQLMDKDYGQLVSEGYEFLIGIGQIKSPKRRIEIYEELKILGAKFATVVSPRAYVSPFAQIGEGTIVMHDVVVNANARVGDNCILNSRSLVEHDALIGDHCHLAPGSIVNGEVKFGRGSFLGSLSAVEQTADISEYSVLSAGVFHRKSNG